MSILPMYGSLFVGPYKGYYGRAEFDPEISAYHGQVTDTKDVITFVGNSPDEVAAAFKDSVEDYLEFCASRGEDPNKPFSGKFLVRVTPGLHHDLSIMAAQTGKSLNQCVVDALAAFVRSGTEAVPEHSYTLLGTQVLVQDPNIFVASATRPAIQLTHGAYPVRPVGRIGHLAIGTG